MMKQANDDSGAVRQRTTGAVRIILLCIGVLVVGGIAQVALFALFSWSGTKDDMYEAKWSEVLLTGLVAFSENQTRLPNDWSEFLKWRNDSDNNPISRDFLEARYRLKWGHSIKAIEPDARLIWVKDDALDVDEDKLNRMLVSRLPVYNVFVRELLVFVETHGRLPKDWSEFRQWSLHTYPDHEVWSEDVLAARYELDWERPASSVEIGDKILRFKEAAGSRNDVEANNILVENIVKMRM